jgi:type I restriction enzyme S subunit
MREFALADLLELTKDGEWGKGYPSPDLEPMTVIRGTDFADARNCDISSIPIRHIPRVIAERKALKPGDILIETAGGTKDQPTGRTVFLKERIFEQAPLRITCASFSRFLRVKQDLIRPDYLFWFLQELYRSGVMYPFHVQHTGVARFQYTQFSKSQKIPVPDFSVQEGVASLLAAFDDKIDLNRRMNETLEATARAVFKDWFVDFGPTRAKMEGSTPYLAPEIWSLFPDLLDNEGKPQGWGERRMEDVLELAYGKSLTASARVEGPIPVYGSSGITGHHNAALVDGPSIIVGRKGTVGSLYWEDGPCFPIDTVFYVNPRTPLTFCFYLLQTLGLEEMNTDAAVPGLNRNNVYRLPVVWASDSVRRAFDGFAKPLREKMRATTAESKTLAATRDLLLPKLMSGEIRVKDAERVAEAAQ